MKPFKTFTVLNVWGKLKTQTDTYRRESVYFTDRRLVFKKQKIETSAEPPPAPVTNLMDIIKSGVLHRLLKKRLLSNTEKSTKNIYK